MRLKSITLKGFKSFPDRTHLDFGPGVSVVVGPNGSGKSNITDAVLWAMGEQSPLAVRGSSMQDVIFGGGRGVQARSEAEVEIVLDNADGAIELPASEISIARRLDRTGEGSYRLNGARCRLGDVIEVLSDTGLGKETHSIISQGRVDAIVTSKPRERRLLIEEAAGLGKHRKRRRRAQLKLERTQENLDRALDVEREARSRLRPLKRQAEAAELHERLERQALEARLALARDAASGARHELADVARRAADARRARAGLERELQQIVERRARAERELSERAERHDALARRLYESRAADERLGLRFEQAAGATRALEARIERAGLEASTLERAIERERPQRSDHPGESRIAALERQLAEIEGSREQELERELAALRAERERHQQRLEQLRAELRDARAGRERADAAAAGAREAVQQAEQRGREARRESERLGAELAAVNEFLRGHARVRSGRDRETAALSDELRVQPGYELALAAALGGRLDAALAGDVSSAQRLLDHAGPEGGTVLLAPLERGHAAASANDRAPTAGGGRAPAPGAQRLVDLISGPPPVLALAERLLADAWVVERLEQLPPEFAGIAATREGRVWFASWGELRQLTAGASERVLARRNEREQLIAAVERAVQDEQAAQLQLTAALERGAATDRDRADAEEASRAAARAQAEGEEELRRVEWLIEQRRAAPAQGPLAVRAAELEGELAAERRQARQREDQWRERCERARTLRSQLQRDQSAVPLGERLLSALGLARAALQERVGALEAQLAGDRRAGEQMAAELRACAAAESELQGRLRDAAEHVTDAEVAAQRARDRAAEVEQELAEIAKRLGLASSDEQEQRLEEEEQQALRARLERLARRREQLGPVNPLAQQEYGEALEHVGELESQRSDLETALRELRSVIRDTDRHIERTFERTFAATARNFEELVADVFPGGTGRLTLVAPEPAPRSVLGGQPLEHDGSAQAADGEAAADAEMEAELRAREGEEPDLPGVEIEITPAGKSSKRLSLLSGGEKSMTALAFVFAVFLAKPCPFYILDEVEAALDDANLDRFLALLRRYSSRAQFVVITHQKRTMEAADWLYGVSMGSDGVSKVLSRRLPADEAGKEAEVARVA